MNSTELSCAMLLKNTEKQNMEKEKTAVGALENSLISIIEKAQETGPKMVDWLYKEVPEVISQLLAWKMAEHLALFILGFTLVFIYPIILYKIFNKLYNYFEVSKMRADMAPNFYIPAILCSVMTIALSQIFGWAAINIKWLQILVAPKVYLLEYVTSLSK